MWQSVFVSASTSIWTLRDSYAHMQYVHMYVFQPRIAFAAQIVTTFELSIAALLARFFCLYA